MTRSKAKMIDFESICIASSNSNVRIDNKNPINAYKNKEIQINNAICHYEFLFSN